MSTSSEIQKAKAILKSDGIVGLPTETVYGLAGAFDSSLAIEKIFKIKERPSFDPLIVHISSIDQIVMLAATWSPTEAFLAKEFWPGPLTIVTKKTSAVSDRISAGLETVGIRMPAHPIAQRLIQEFGKPLAAPSANKFGKTSPTRADHVRAEFKNEDLFVLDGGDSEVGIDSTVLRVEESSPKISLKILRPGLITPSDLREKIEAWSPKELVISSGATSASPGATETHYQPTIPLVISPRSPSQDLVTNIEKKFGIKALSRYSELNLNTDPRLAARDLYAKMRELSSSGSKWMFVRRSNERQGEIWSSIWNRLEKAASLKVD